MSKTCLEGNPSPLLVALQHSRHAWPPFALRGRLWKTHCLSLLPKAGGVNTLPALGWISIEIVWKGHAPSLLTFHPSLTRALCVSALSCLVSWPYVLFSVCYIDQASQYIQSLCSLAVFYWCRNSVRPVQCPVGLQSWEWKHLFVFMLKACPLIKFIRNYTFGSNFILVQPLINLRPWAPLDSDVYLFYRSGFNGKQG